MIDIRLAPRAPDELQGRIIAVTGASDGIGRAVATAAAAHGAEVILLGRNLRKLQAAHADIEAVHGPVASMAQLDFEKALAGDYDRIAAAVLERHGRLDGLVHCAAQVGGLTPIEQFDVPTWCRVLHVNLTSAFVLTQVLLPALRLSRDGSIVFTSSTVGRRGRAYWGAYAASKFAIEGLSQVLAEELSGNTTVRVNALNPGPTRTLLRRQAYPSEDLSRLPLPADVAGPYITLLGPQSRGITGQSLDCQ
ncbi:MAG TPA: YciK family oxidoreductase [Steroidobacteraceae bacterium]|jgi:NAD(P)-dependent dehydrogenase (short-subunit alcohol dehydrogenase family)|nr:YciK family oxidoreductase [Steroidobacteraceae bacterium]